MRNRIIKNLPLLRLFFIGLSIIGSFLFYFANVNLAWAAGDYPNDAIQLNIGTTVDDTITTSGQARWYKVYLTNDAIYNSTHLVIQTYGNMDTYLKVYGDLESATKDNMYHEDDDSGDGRNAMVKMPIAFMGPYYIKVTGYSSYTGSFQLNVSNDTYPPEEREGGACAVEAVTSNAPSGKAILSNIRALRDDLFKNTAQGENLISVYYKASPYLLKAIIIDEDTRATIYRNLIQLQPVIKEAAALGSGKSSSYVITEQDYASLVELRNVTKPWLPDDINSKIDALWNIMGVSTYAGMELTDCLSAAKLNYVNFLSGKGYIKYHNNIQYIADELIIKLKPGSKAQNIGSAKINSVEVNHVLQAHGVKDIKPFKLGKGNSGASANEDILSNVYLVKLAGESQADSLAVASQLKNISNVDYAEPNYIMQAFSNDVYYNYQWSLENTGQDNGIAGADINYTGIRPQLIGKNLNKTLIAVVDTGVNYKLADFSGIVRTDLDWDYVNDDDDAMDDCDHGTHVAGIIGARIDNGFSMSGINSYAEILPVKVLASDGSGSAVNVAQGIIYAVDKGAKVINLSLGVSEVCSVVEDALKYAAYQDVLCVAAAGNDGNSSLSYPASSSYTLSVGATDNMDIRASFSNYGSYLDVMAPGVHIPSLVKDGSVMYADGTSMATPHVAALAGLLYSLVPTMTCVDAARIIKEGCDDLGDQGYDTGYGWGRVDAVKVINGAQYSRTVTSVSLSTDKASPQPIGTAVTFSASAVGSSNPQYSFWVQDPNGVWTSSGAWTSTNTYQINSTIPGTYQVIVYAKDSQASQSQAFDSSSFTFTSGTTERVTSVSLSTDKASPQPIGTTVTFTASAVGSSNPQYSFWVQDPNGVWTSSGAWTSTNTYQINNAIPGIYQVIVYAKDSQASQSQAFDSSSFTFTSGTTERITSVSLSTDKASPQPVGTTVTFTASAVGSNNPQYSFWVQDPNGVWTSSGAWTSTNTYQINSTIPGIYQVIVYAKDSQASQSQAFDLSSFTFTSGTTERITSVSLSTDKASPQPAGIAVTFTANAVGSSNPQYSFWVQDPNGSWTNSGPWSNNNTYQLTNTIAGNYIIIVYAKDFSAAEWQAFNSTEFTFN
ncbi:S8 family serine peptidase [Desulfoscipio gibsoniae]|uniref:Subtilisin-like serine protease n=1 Tax=Desulfoscipio gibsoniae DSM 7213 TaxID=767817 RepID=R4KSW9_9FIRM|nr:S8 family serine peptidase [Desulfoscipio gibsoniae]AGL03690.1 subtilisin-like serine protease [Desulfoscipio gibsoniae DSM 7213]